MSKLTELEAFMRLLHAVQNVQRVARIPNETKLRNTAEHTFELAMTAWFITSTNQLDLKLEKILQYALAHDLVEGYAGDTPAYDTEGQKTKIAREAAALQRIEAEFAHFPDLIATIHAYEQRADAESKFVYATDKLIDPLNAGRETTKSIWKEYDISYAELRAYKDHKIARSKDIQPYWDELCAKLEDHREFFFDR